MALIWIRILFYNVSYISVSLRLRVTKKVDNMIVYSLWVFYVCIYVCVLCVCGYKYIIKSGLIKLRPKNDDWDWILGHNIQ